jgi:hypothetical protein
VNSSARSMSSPFEPDIPALWARCGAVRRVPRPPRAVRAATRMLGGPFAGRDPTWDAVWSSTAQSQPALRECVPQGEVGVADEQASPLAEEVLGRGATPAGRVDVLCPQAEDQLSHQELLSYSLFAPVPHCDSPTRLLDATKLNCPEEVV